MTAAAVFVTGDEELDKALREIGGRIAGRVVTKGIRAGMGEIMKAIRSELTHASAKRAIAHRFKKKKRRNYYSAVVGGGVGKRNKGRGGTNGGVGMSKQNIHWLLMGTSGRQTKSGANRGAMPKNGAVQRGYAKSGSAAMAGVQQKIRTELMKEVQKLKTR